MLRTGNSVIFVVWRDHRQKKEDKFNDLLFTQGKREATDEWFMLTRKYHLALAQVDLTGTRMTYK